MQQLDRTNLGGHTRQHMQKNLSQNEDKYVKNLWALGLDEDRWVQIMLCLVAEQGLKVWVGSCTPQNVHLMTLLASRHSLPPLKN